MTPAATPGGLDTNVLVRYLVSDDPDQLQAAQEHIEAVCTPQAPGLIHPVMLCELVWVLRSAYDVPKPKIADVLDMLLQTRALRVLDADIVRDALRVYREQPVDFADAFLHVAYQHAGAAGLVTFDRRAGTLSGARTLRG